MGESEAIQLFYYFVESERNPKEDALFLWLTGGPGCSAFSGLIYEIGEIEEATYCVMLLAQLHRFSPCKSHGDHLLLQVR